MLVSTRTSSIAHSDYRPRIIRPPDWSPRPVSPRMNTTIWLNFLRIFHGPSLAQKESASPCQGDTMQTRLLSALALAAGLAVAAPAGAQPQRGGWGQPRVGGAYGTGQAAYDNGYREGLRAGERDARSGQRYDVRRDDAYKDGDRGYNGRYGSRNDYRDTFRRGFEQGYSEGYYGRNGRAVPRDPNYGRYPTYPSSGRYPTYPSYPNSGRYPDNGRYPNGGYGGYYSPASDKGYSDGYEKGLDDGRDNDRFDPVGEKWYRQGDRGYEKHYGSKDVYKNQYRQAFRDGYERGYQDGRTGRTSRNGGFRWPW
jgi:hypothetical protein